MRAGDELPVQELLLQMPSLASPKLTWALFPATEAHNGLCN